MRSFGSFRSNGVALTVFWLVSAVPVKSALAQGSSNAAPVTSDGGTGMIPLAVLVAVIVAAIIGAAKVHDRRQTRENEALALQAQLSDTLLGDSMLGGVPITVTIHNPIWRRAPAVAEVRGQVPTPELRETILHVLEQELSRRQPGVRIDDRIVVSPPVGAASRAA